MAADLIERWSARTAYRGGYFVRYKDGNKDNTADDNLEMVHPYEAFVALCEDKGFVDDWFVGLSEVECDFVRENAYNFAMTYQESAAKLAARQRGDDDPDVVAMTAKGDAAMADGDFDRAQELYAAAMERRKAVIASRQDASFVYGDAPREQSTSPKAQYGRRSGNGSGGGAPKGGVVVKDRPSVISSKPAGRIQAMPSKREEVRARIAARDAAPR